MRTGNKQFTVYLYVVGATSDPDKVKCVVPYRVNENEIFFGPCKKRIRKELRDKYLSEKNDYAEPNEEIYFIGVNASNNAKKRKIIYIGKINKIMTFEYAYNHLKESRYDKMRQFRFSPMHIKPLYNDNNFIGYKHISDEHINKNEWIDDLIKKRNQNTQIDIANRTIYSSGNWTDFPRDACFLMENVFFADKDKNVLGIEIEEELISILQEVQNNADIDKYAIFGYQQNGNAEGKRGGHLKIENTQAHFFIETLKRKIYENNSQ